MSKVVNTIVLTRERVRQIFVLDSTQHIVDSVNLTKNCHVCSSLKNTLSEKVEQTCCQMTKSNLATE